MDPSLEDYILPLKRRHELAVKISKARGEVLEKAQREHNDHGVKSAGIVSKNLGENDGVMQSLQYVSRLDEKLR